MWNGGRHAGTQLNHPALWQSLLAFDWVGATEMHKYVIRCFLHAGSRSVEPAGCLGRKLGKEIAIGYVCYCAENQIRSHVNLLTN